MESREIVKLTLKEFAALPSQNNATQDKTVFDDEAGVYQWLSYGWHDMKRIFNVIVHIEIHDGLVWIERNASDIEIGEVLAEKGIPKSKIVLGFQAPYKRGLHGYATG
jgi:XisI protein